jgi:hypothetical protein
MTKLERCERTYLFKSDCAHCRPASNIDPMRSTAGRKVQVGDVFSANYFSRCPECGERITPGDSIVGVTEDDDTRYVHEGCED